METDRVIALVNGFASFNYKAKHLKSENLISGDIVIKDLTYNYTQNIAFNEFFELAHFA